MSSVAWWGRKEYLHNVHRRWQVQLHIFLLWILPSIKIPTGDSMPSEKNHISYENMFVLLIFVPIQECCMHLNFWYMMRTAVWYQVIRKKKKKRVWMQIFSERYCTKSNLFLQPSIMLVLLPLPSTSRINRQWVEITSKGFVVLGISYIWGWVCKWWAYKLRISDYIKKICGA